jgi:sulfite reductase beta subunit-like hemoprotein
MGRAGCHDWACPAPCVRVHLHELGTKGEDEGHGPTCEVHQGGDLHPSHGQAVRLGEAGQIAD